MTTGRPSSGGCSPTVCFPAPKNRRCPPRSGDRFPHRQNAQKQSRTMTLIERMSALFFVQFSQNYFIVAIPLAIGLFGLLVWAFGFL